MPHTPIQLHSAVPTEVFPDHMVLRPPNKLKERATRLASPNDVEDVNAVVRAEHALGLLSQEFEAWMDAEIGRLEAAHVAASKTPNEETVAELYRSAHDLRGQAATFGFPLAGEIAEGLCVLIERMGSRLPPQDLIDTHVESIKAIVRENAKGRDHPLGATLTRRVAQLRDQIAPPLEGQ